MSSHRRAVRSALAESKKTFADQLAKDASKPALQHPPAAAPEHIVEAARETQAESIVPEPISR